MWAPGVPGMGDQCSGWASLSGRMLSRPRRPRDPALAWSGPGRSAGGGVAGRHTLVSDLTPGRRHGRGQCWQQPAEEGPPGLASLLLGYLSVFAHLLPRPHVGVEQKGEMGQRWAGVSGFQEEAGARQVFAKEAALLRVCARAAGSRGLHWAESDKDPGVGRWVPCVLVGTIVSLWDRPRGQVMAERAESVWPGMGVGMIWPPGPYSGGGQGP